MERTKEIYKVTIVGSAVNVLLLVLKFVAGVLGHSSAMVADAVHSLSDFLTDIIVLIFVKISGKPQDKSHEYGHGKFETLALTIIGLVLVLVALGIISDGVVKIDDFFEGQTLEAPGMLALWAAVASILLKEAVYRYSIIKARKLQSQALEANAWHHRSDALSSLGTTIGIAGAIFLGDRWTVLDPLASVVVGLVLVKVALGLLKTSIAELTECSLPQDTEQEIEEIIKATPGVSEPHNLRTRHIGNRKAIEVHIRMDGDISLNEAHERTSAIERKLKERFGDTTHITIHMEPTKINK